MRNRLALAVVVSALPFAAAAAQSRFSSPPVQTQQSQQHNERPSHDRQPSKCERTIATPELCDSSAKTILLSRFADISF